MSFTNPCRLLVVLCLLLVACGKPDVTRDSRERKAELSKEEAAQFDKELAEARKSVALAEAYKKKAMAGDLGAAKSWRGVVSAHNEGPGDILWVIRDANRNDPVNAARFAQLDAFRRDRAAAGWEGEGFEPLWFAAKLGDPSSQFALYARSKEIIHTSHLMNAGRGKLSLVKGLQNPKRLESHAYMVDSFWTPPEGSWDPYYIDGRARYDGIEFSPRDWLVKAAASDPRYKDDLASIDFIIAKNDAERKVAAASLLSSVDNGGALVAACKATIHLRGIATPVDLERAARIMIESGDDYLKARGVKLACERNLVIGDAANRFSLLSRPRRGMLLQAVQYRYGYLGAQRDTERAYYNYWLCVSALADVSFADSNFARNELREIEQGLSADGIRALQRKCARVHANRKYSYADFESDDEWHAAWDSADQQKAR